MRLSTDLCAADSTSSPEAKSPQASILFDTLNTPAIVIRKDGTAKWMNTQASELTGWSVAEFGRIPVFVALAAREPETNRKITISTNHDGSILFSPAVSDHFIFTSKDQLNRHVSCTAVGLGNGDLQHDSLLVFSDISKHLEIAPAVEEHRLQVEHLIEASDVATWVLDVQTGKLEVNDRWFSMLGYKPRELGPTNMALWKSIAHPDDHLKTVELLDAHFQNATPRYESDVRMKHKNGHWVWVHAVGKVKEWSRDGRPKTLIGSHQDITARKITEQKSISSEAHLRSLLDTLFVNVAVLSPDGRLEWANSVPLAAGSLKASEIVGQYFWETPWFSHAKDVAEKIEQACKTAARGGQVRFDLGFTSEQGRYKVFDFMISPLIDEQGSVTHLIPTAADVSERHAMMQELAEAKSLMESVLEHIPAMVYVKDAKDFRYTHLNRTGELMMSRKRGELIGKSVYDFFPADQAAQFVERDRQALESKDGIEVLDQPVTVNDGELRYYRTSKVAMRNAEGIPTHLVGISLDVTELVESKEILKNLNRELEDRVAERTIELAASEAKFRTAMHKSSIGMALVKSDGRWLDVNSKIVDMLGYEKEQLQTLTFQQITHPEDLAPDLAKVDELLAGKIENYQLDKRFIHRNGHLVWVRLNVSLAKDDNHGCYFISQLQDITKEKLSELATSAITEELLSLDSEAYCRRTVEVLSELLKTNAAFISEVDEDTATSIHTRSLFLDGRHLPTRHYKKTGMSLNDISADKHTKFLDSDYQYLYAENTFLEEQGIRAYAEVPMYDSSGKLTGYIGVMDRERIQYTDALADVLNIFSQAIATTLERDKSQKRYADLFKYAPDGLLMLDSVGVIKLANHAAADQLGYDSSEILGRNFYSLLAPRETTQIRRFLESHAVLGSTSASEITTYAMKRSGVEYPLELRVRSIRDHDGWLTNVTLTDLTQRFEAEREMRQALAMLDATEDAAFIVDPQTHIFTYVNKAACTQLGYSKNELLEMGPASIIPNMTRDTLKEDLQRIYLKPEQFAEFETKHQLKDGTQIPVKVSLRFLQLPNNQACYVALARDISERLQQQADRDARIEAEQANAAKSAFLAAMSHEIRTPMNGVIGSVDLLARSSLMAQQVDLVTTISESANGLLRVIDDILDFSKIDAGKLEIESEPVCLRHDLESTCAALIPVALEKNVILRLFTDPTLPNWIVSDSVRIRQIVNNLVSNAIKFSSRQAIQGRVSVCIESIENNQVKIVVADNGIGMKSEALANLFQPFSQAESSTTRRFGGTGLGLSICKRLVDLLNGTISVESNFGHGSTFTVTLPIVVDNQTSPPPTDPELRGLFCVLLAPEELEPTRQCWATYLSYSGAQVEITNDVSKVQQILTANERKDPIIITTAHSEQDALEWLKSFNHQRKPRLVILNDGQRRIPREIEPGITCIDSTAMAMRNFLLAVAISSGKSGYEAELETMGGERKPVNVDRTEAMKQGRLILVAEDNEVNRKVIRRQLDMLGYAADIKVDGREALYAWQTGNYGLLLTDLHMPELDGYELTETIRQAQHDGKRIPIIALTANALKDEKARCIKRGMDDYLTKPIALDRLEQALIKWLPKISEDSCSDSELLKNAGAASENDDFNDSLPILDTTVLAGLIGDAEDLIHEFLLDYLATLEQCAEEIREGFANQDLVLAHDAAHKLKSSSRSVGAMALGECCHTIENMAAADAAALSVEFEMRYGELHTALESKLGAKNSLI